MVFFASSIKCTFRAMGIIKKLLRPLTKESEQMIVQAKAIMKQDKIEHGEKVLPPKYPTDEKYFKAAQEDKKIKEVCFWIFEVLISTISGSSKASRRCDSECEQNYHQVFWSAGATQIRQVFNLFVVLIFYDILDCYLLTRLSTSTGMIPNLNTVFMSRRWKRWSPESWCCAK